MEHHVLQRHFARLGARLRIEIAAAMDWRFRWRSDDYVLDLVQDRRSEVFDLAIRHEAKNDLVFLAADVRPDEQHLLLVVKRHGPSPNKEKFLCGHDERHWFLAPVPDAQSVASVHQAMEALKPPAVRRSQHRQRVKRKDRNRRRNDGFIRQGEWFFLPRPDFVPENSLMLLRNEPMQRSGGTPHIVEEVYRTGGQTVYVNRRYPQGLSEQRYRKLVTRKPKAARLDWQVMRVNPTVYARGKVRHPDHATIMLPCWHQVVMNTEGRVSNVLFLD